MLIKQGQSIHWYLKFVFMYMCIIVFNDKNYEILENFKTITQYRFYSYKEYVKDDIMSLYPYYITNQSFLPSLYSLFLEILCYKLGINRLRWTEDQPNITSCTNTFDFPHEISIQLPFDIVNIVLYLYISI